jgi:fructokinase
MKTIIGIGEILWDVFPERKVLGGAPANFAWHVSQLGYKGIAVSSIGNDDLGQEILGTLVDVRRGNFMPLLATVDFPTGTVAVTLDGKGVPQYEIFENVAWDNIPLTSETEEAARKCVAVCFGSLAQRSEVSRATILRLLELTPPDAYKIFDINLRQQFYNRDIIRKSMFISNVLKINDEELSVIARLFGYETLTEQEISLSLLRDYQLKMVILTRGDKGSYIFTAEEVSYLDTPKVNVADTVGAGDAFTAAFITAILDGKAVKSAHLFAVDVAAYVCTQNGAMPELPETLKNNQ